MLTVQQKKTEEEYLAAMEAYRKLRMQEPKASDIDLANKRNLLFAAAQAHFEACGVPPNMLKLLMQDPTKNFDPAVVQQFKGELNTFINDKRAEINDLESQWAKMKIDHANILSQNAAPNYNTQLQELTKKISKTQAELKPLLDSSTGLANDSESIRNILTGLSQTLGVIASPLVAAAWVAGGIVVYAAEAELKALGPSFTPIKEIIPAIAGAIHGAAVAFPTAGQKFYHLQTAGEYTYNNQSQRSLNHLLDDLIKVAEDSQQKPKSEDESSQERKRSSTFQNPFATPKLTRH